MARGKKVKATPEIQLDEILKNAIRSIQLGVEDYETSCVLEEDARAISAARNLYAGVLLLFKYKISSLAASPEQARELLYKPEKMQPERNASGLIEWRPTPHSRETIDASMIKSRLQGLGIYHDWRVVESLRNCRNDLEHLHPTAPASDIQRLIVDLFPMLQRFAHEELNTSPAELLGQAWKIMLREKSFYEQTQNDAKIQWQTAGLPGPALDFLQTCMCEACRSTLLQPCKASIDNCIPIDTGDFLYECISCKHSQSLIEFIEYEFLMSNDEFLTDEGIFVKTCEDCYITMESLLDGRCYWCGKQGES